MIPRVTGEVPALEPEVIERVWDVFDERLFELADFLHRHGLRRGVALDAPTARRLAVDVLGWMRGCLDESSDVEGDGEPQARRR